MDSPFEDLASSVEEVLTKIGVYMVNIDYGAIPVDEDAALEIVESNVTPEDSFKNGQTKLFLSGTFIIGDAAWSDRVLRPERFDEKRQFELIAPTETEMEIESLRSELLDWDEE
jgi:hypothetical protein